MAPLATASPFIGAILFILISPMLVTRVKKTVQAQILEDKERLRIPRDAEVPPPLTPKAVNEYIEYATDAIQILPATLLPVIGAIFTVSNNGASELTIGLLCLMFLVFLAAVAMDLGVTISSTADYVSRKFHGYSIAALVALASNVLGLVVSLITAPTP